MISTGWWLPLVFGLAGILANIVSGTLGFDHVSGEARTCD
jgi:hypothetical protein